MHKVGQHFNAYISETTSIATLDSKSRLIAIRLQDIGLEWRVYHSISRLIFYGLGFMVRYSSRKHDLAADNKIDCIGYRTSNLPEHATRVARPPPCYE